MMDEFISQAKELVKARLGISTTIRDTYLQEIVKSVVSELNEVQGLSLNNDSPHHLMFVVDYASWRYLNRDSLDGMPRHLQFRLHNLMIQQHASGDEDGDV